MRVVCSSCLKVVARKPPFQDGSLTHGMCEACCALLGKAPRDVIGLLGGEALECARARLPGGCGRTEHCPSCTIRHTVTRTHETGQPVEKVPATLRRAGGGVDLLISTALDGNLVRVTIERAPPP